MGTDDSSIVQENGVEEGDIRSNLLGNISTHLASLQGFDVMALELIQNADDAGAKTIRFEVTPEYLGVWNDGEFDYCGAINTHPCSKTLEQRASKKNAACDFHQITEVGFGGKLSNPDNIGRFGIGFVSVYQITDQPDILSANQRLSLIVGRGRYQLRANPQTTGSQFILPWARDPDSQTRRGLQCSPVTDELIEQLKADIGRTITTSLLFLRNVTTAELFDEGRLIARCTIDRNAPQSEGEKSSPREIVVSLEPSNVVEHWLVLEADASQLRAPIVAKYPILERHKRKTKVTIAIRVAPEPLDTGFLYAFLPTKQATRLPLHINADFYPAASREKAIFDGQHEKAWNEMLIRAAAYEIGSNLEFLCQKLGHVGLWNLIKAAFALQTPQGGETPAVYSAYWLAIDDLLSTIDSIVLTRDGRSVGAWEVTIPPTSITASEAEAYQAIGGSILAESLRTFSNVLTYKSRAKPLSLEDLIAHINAAARFEPDRTVSNDELLEFFVPLWSLADRLIQEISGLQELRKRNAIDRLKTCVIAINNRGHLSRLSESFDILPSLRDDVESVLPEISLLAKELSQKVNVALCAPKFSFAVLVRHLKNELGKADGWTPPVDTPKLKRFYQLLHRMDAASPAAPESIEILRQLPIWKCGNHFVSAANALLHGDFTDPLGRSELIDDEVIDPSVRGFLEERLQVKRQSPRAFIENVVPKIFAAPEILTTEKYKKLIVQLGNHLSLLDDPKILLSLQQLPMVPTSDGNWQSPFRVYFFSEHLSKVLGQDAKHLWLDANRVPSQPSAQKFLERLGVRREPSAQDLVSRLREISQTFKPTVETRKMAQEPFYELCGRYGLWVELGDKESIDVISKLSGIECLPAIGCETEWFSPSEIYAPYQAKAFESQAPILAYQDTKRLKTEFLEAIGISINPETKLVVNHLLHCISTQRTFDPKPIYEVLNQQALKESERAELRRLTNEPCIGVGPERYVRPGRVFWGSVHLPGFAFSLTSEWDRYKQLFSIIGVKESPSAEDLGEIVLELIADYDKTLLPLTGPRLEIYRQCLGVLAYAHEDGTLQSKPIWKSLEQASLALDLLQQPSYPDELLLLDSEWLYSYFGETLDESLSRSPMDWLPLLSDLGMTRLSDKATVEIDVIEEQAKGLTEYEVLIRERTEPVARVLHAQRRELIGKISEALQSISVETCTTLNVRAVVEIEGNPQFSEPKPVPTFYSLTTNTLSIRVPCVEDLWLHAFNAILHQFLSQEAMTDVAQLSMNCAQIMDRSDLASCHRYLDTAGIPPLQDLSNPTDQLAPSEEVGLIGGEDTSPEIEQVTDEQLGNEEIEASPSDVDEDGESKESPPDNLPGSDSSPIPIKSENTTTDPNVTSGTQVPGNSTPGQTGAEGEVQQPGGDAGEGDTHDSPGTYTLKNNIHRRKGRAKHKTQRDQALATYIYVRPADQDEEDDMDDSGDEEGHRHRMALEFASRTTVCRFESEHGRNPEQLGQKNPGYDIISVNPKTGETRYIEVKAINGAWNKTGVGLSKTQFLNAQNIGEKFWLYVVEFALEPYPEVSKVSTIQNPAHKANYFFFDGGWRGLAADTKYNPLDAFVVGARGIFGSWGNGTIKERRVSENGSISLIVDVDGTGTKLITPRVANGLMRIFMPGEES
jgi:hypothetical protein